MNSSSHDPAVAPRTDYNRDRAAVLLTVQSVAHFSDLHQWDALAALFAPNVTLDYGQAESVPPIQICGRWAPLLSAFDATQHVLSEMTVVELDEDTARVESSFVATHTMAGRDAGGDVWKLAGRYVHLLVRTNRGWKISAMKMIPGESSGNPTLLDLAKSRAEVHKD